MAAASPPALAGTAPSTQRGLRVLIIEGEPDDLSPVHRLLRQRELQGSVGYQAHTVAEATALLRSTPVDVILADLSLADADGLDVVLRCREASASVPIVVMTGCVATAASVERFEEGVQEYLIKGEFDDADLARAIRYALARSRVDAALRSTVEELRETNRQLEEYAAVAAHDLRSPIRTARVLASRLVTSPAARSDPQSVELAAALDACLSRLDKMLQGLLEYAQAGAPGAADVATWVSVRDLVADTVHDLGVDLRAASAVIHVEADHMIWAHAGLLREVLANLVQNAMKYRSPERPLILGIGSAVLPGGTVEIRVTDNGIGIEPKHRTRVFEAFERLSSTGDGIGLGLALCRRIISLHHGRIWIEDGATGHGTAVCIALPPPRGLHRETM